MKTKTKVWALIESLLIVPIIVHLIIEKQIGIIFGFIIWLLYASHLLNSGRIDELKDKIKSLSDDK